MQDDAVERGSEPGDAVLAGCGGQRLVEPVKLTEDTRGSGLGGDPDGLPTDSGSQGHVACTRMGTGGTSEADAAVPAVCGRKYRDGAVEAGCGLLIVAECSEGAGSGGADVCRIEPRTPDAIGARATEKGECGVVSPVGFTAFTEYGMCMGLVQNGDDFETAPGPGGAPGGGEAEGVGRMTGVDRELGLTAEDVRGEISVAGDVGSVERFRGATVGGAFVADVLGEPACQLFVSRLQGEKFDGLGATGGAASRGKGDEVFLQRRQQVPGTDEVVGLDHHPAELREVLEGRPHLGEFGGSRRRRGRDGCRNQAGDP
ncbi:hypothetical protein ABZ826_29260 [Streptomyces sp. NPDC047515]|uniref:hypothetical protein n=1 Tax=Streptomyces sp. NPDC047515 TaxID=3155380 RepID=UPI0033F5513A